MSTILVVGATGYLGRHLVAELHRRGHRVRAVVQDRARAREEGAWGAPALEGAVDEWTVGNVTDEAFVRDLAAGADHVVSALGVTRQKADPWDVDYRANLTLLASALAHGATSFTYLNVLGGERCPVGSRRRRRPSCGSWRPPISSRA